MLLMRAIVLSLIVLFIATGADARGCRFSVDKHGHYGGPKSGRYCPPF